MTNPASAPAPGSIATVLGAPARWEVRRFKTFAREVVDLSTTGSEELLTVSHITGVTPRSEKNVYMFMAESLKGYKRVRPGDLVVNTMWAWMGALGVSRQEGVVSPSYATYRLDTTHVYPPFVEMLLRSPALVSEIARASTGVWLSRLRLYPEALLDLRVPLPPLNEQRAVADYRAVVFARMDGIANRLQRILALLNERRQAVINAATARGALGAANWSSPVEAAVSEWKTTRLKYLVSINQRVLPEDTPSDYEFRYIDISAAGRGRLIEEPQIVTFGNAPSRARRLVRRGDTIVSTVRTYLRAVWPVTDGFEDLVVSTGFAVLTPRSGAHPMYLSWLIQSDAVIEDVVRRSVGISYPAISPWDIGDIKVRVPPVDSQRDIAAYLERETARIDRLVDRLEAMLQLLAERKQALVTTALAGRFSRVAA